MYTFVIASCSRIVLMPVDGSKGSFLFQGKPILRTLQVPGEGFSKVRITYATWSIDSMGTYSFLKIGWHIILRLFLFFWSDDKDSHGIF